MSIPKVIHYCWFGGHPLPKEARRCIQSWKKYCPDYKIVQWNEKNFNVFQNRYTSQAYQAGKWAFISDYARLKILYEHGGIYLDTDVELLKSLNPLLHLEGYMGFENDKLVASGLGFGAVKGAPFLKKLLDDYEDIPFIQEDGTPDMTPCTDRTTWKLQEFGLSLPPNGLQEICGFTIFPRDYFCPMDYYSGITKKTKNTYSIHHYEASWLDPKRKAAVRYDRRKNQLRHFLGPNIYHFLEIIWNLLHGRIKRN